MECACMCVYVWAQVRGHEEVSVIFTYITKGCIYTYIAPHLPVCYRSAGVTMCNGSGQIGLLLVCVHG